MLFEGLLHERAYWLAPMMQGLELMGNYEIVLGNPLKTNFNLNFLGKPFGTIMLAKILQTNSNEQEKMRTINPNTKLVPKIIATHNSYKSSMMQNKFTTNENYKSTIPYNRNHNENFDA